MSSSGGGGGGSIGGGGGAGGGGCGCGSNGNGGAGSGVWSLGMKKQQKRPKIPKRGPGVAELEKILREQEKSERSGINNNDDDDDNVEGFSVSHSCFNLHPHSSAPLKPHCPPRSSPPPPPPMTAISRPPPPSHVPIAPRFDNLSPPPPPPPAHLYGYNTATQGRNFPEQLLFPVNQSSSDGLSQPDHHHQHHSANSSSKNFFNESSNNHLWSSYSALPQKRHCTSQYSSTMVKQFLGPSAPPPSSSSSLSTGLHNHHEPPSNQSSYFNCISRNPEEPTKMVGMKRPYACSSFEKPLVPSSTFQVPPIYSNFISRPQNKSSSNNDNHISASNFTSSNNDCFRDMKWGDPLGFNSSRKFGSYEINGGLLGHSSFSSFINGAPVPSPPMLMFQRELCNNNINALPNFQVPEERMEESYQKSGSSSGSDHQRPFFNFLEVKELVGMKETRVGSNHEGSEEGIDGPDLTLKL